jgi:hypothetical protein
MSDDASKKVPNARMIIITMPDGSTWGVPALVVAKDRAEHYREDGYNEERDFALSESGESELMDWAAGNMNWDDVKEHAFRIKPRPDLTDDDFQEGWVNGEKEVRRD